jgi:hypothetical protein
MYRAQDYGEELPDCWYAQTHDQFHDEPGIAWAVVVTMDRVIPCDTWPAYDHRLGMEQVSWYGGHASYGFFAAEGYASTTDYGALASVGAQNIWSDEGRYFADLYPMWTSLTGMGVAVQTKDTYGETASGDLWLSLNGLKQCWALHGQICNPT